ncbi:MAG: BamA/TamA family outer membrane protein, partial [Flammeovirgaceae bacterium]|nr:BamA/TamA family outer membrane protein [Flammeovirgaceae bacterium]
WDQRKIYNLRLFNVVTIRSLQITPTTIDLLVDVQERWYTWPAPIFELSDRNFTEWWQNYNHDFGRVNFGLRLDQFNVRGRNETLRFIAQFGFSQRFELSYTIPYLDKKQKQGLILNLDYSNPKNIAALTEDHKLVFVRGSQPLRIAFGAQVSYTYRKSFFETHVLTLGFKNTEVTDTVLRKNPNYFSGNSLTQNYGILSYSFRSEHRDVVMYPLKGYQFSATVQRNGFGFEGNVSQWIVNLTYAYHLPLRKDYFFSNFTSAYISDPVDQPYNLYGAMGYQRQILRGHDIYVIEGPKFFVNKTTLKKKIFSRVWRYENMPLEQFRHIPLSIYIKGFVDVGYAENYAYYQESPAFLNNRLSNTLLAGYGGGLDVVAPYDVVFRFEYAFTKEGANGFFFNIKKEF